jgi:hypothetical protein
VQSIVLVGSLARGEATVLEGPSGRRLLGDIELLVVLRQPFDLSSSRRLLASVSRQVSRELSGCGSPLNVEYVPAGLDYLARNIRPSIFAFDLAAHGRVVWGDGRVLELLRPVSAGAIPREDALTLAMNRIVELLLLEWAPDVTRADPLPAAYQIDKTLLDLAGSALAFFGGHESRYSERASRLRVLVRSEPLLASALEEDYLEELDKATECKLRPSVELLLRGNIRERFARVMRWARNISLWEMRTLTGAVDADLDSLIQHYLRRESRRSRLRGWVKYWCHPLRPPNAIQPARAVRLMFKASPHSLTYAILLMGLEARLEGGTRWAHDAESLLPARFRSSGSDVFVEAGEVWRWLVRNN